jgi:hypothetical protein
MNRTTDYTQRIHLHYLELAAELAKQDVEQAKEFIAKYGDPNLRFAYDMGGEITPVERGDGTPINDWDGL